MLIEKNEQIGYYRSIGQYDKMMEIAEELERLVVQLGVEESVEGATTYVNVATAYRANHDSIRALEFYKKAKEIYDLYGIQDERLASLYNNQSMAYQDLDRNKEAVECLEHALSIMECMENGESEIATTCVNLATVYFQMESYDEGRTYLMRAIRLFESGKEPDAHYSGALALLGQSYYLEKNYEKSIEAYTKAIGEILEYFGKNESYAITCENCAMVLDAIDQREAAERLRKEAKSVREQRRKTAKRISGLELSRQYYETYGKPMLEKEFPDDCERMAVGLVGYGSECLGYDDEWSEDHDFGPGFCIWLTKKDYDEIGGKVQEAYHKLPDGFLGYTGRNVSNRGTGRVGVFEINEFYKQFAGSEEELAMAVNGEVFSDPLGEFTRIRNELKKGDPFDVWKRKVANAAALMAQSGQYNYERCKRRGDDVAKSLALNLFIKEAMHMIYLLNHKYMLYYKWAYRGLDACERLREIKPLLKKLLTEEDNLEQIDTVCKMVLEELRRQNLTYGEEVFLEMHVDRILEAQEGMNPIIPQIVEIEWEMFQKVRNEGGRASCQNDFETFDIMRKSQYLAWTLELLESYKQDLEDAKKQGRNLIMEKYAYMMEQTEPEAFQKIEKDLPKISQEKSALIEQIVQIQVGWREDFAKRFPNLSVQARNVHSDQDTLQQVSFETYLRGELKTYSLQTLFLYGRNVVEISKNGKNLTEEIMQNTVRFYGYSSLEEAEKKQGRG